METMPMSMSMSLPMSMPTLNWITQQWRRYDDDFIVASAATMMIDEDDADADVDVDVNANADADA